VTNQNQVRPPLPRPINTKDESRPINTRDEPRPLFPDDSLDEIGELKWNGWGGLVG
jgi:hypothetical protein